MPQQRYKVEGTATITFEAEIDADDLSFHDEDDYESAIAGYRQSITLGGDPFGAQRPHTGAGVEQ